MMVVSLSLTPATKIFIRVARNCGSFIIYVEDIDYAISKSWSVNDFYNNIKKMGYEYKIRAEKISIRKYPAKKYVRLQRAFGDEYSIENIKNKIISRYPEIEEEYKEYKTLNLK